MDVIISMVVEYCVSFRPLYDSNENDSFMFLHRWYVCSRRCEADARYRPDW